ncbi:uncharacterized protein PODANS_2_3395 [Podospora anserina S mat+]|uniref:Podospora anserina S mat+ genomic DNA chromosome 2, supercontig 2 n=1 Tax=Podospora anserina (strain S / ATCC MYA-4624 / DSM 980 / FGSC 10383) TaxID=515849 RepID=B2B538_PODAN|nr:uncharacterized protein PODANS_2_3395 [Podospora anserina S mat+]CAP72913.1 unnamed protein product [Podospora anserina S mat+]CDP25313.1 Putative protein of unknown function [Podospora anserina S mat+]
MGGYHDVEFPHEEPGFFPRSPPFHYPDGLRDGIADFSITDPALGLEQHGPVSVPVVQPILVPPQPPAQETPMTAVVDATAPPGGTDSGINGGSGAPTNGNRGPSPACSYGSSPAPAASPAAVKDDGNGGSNDKQGSDGNDESNNTGGQSTASWSIVHSLPRLTRCFLTPRLYVSRHCLCFLRPFSYTGLEGLVHFWKRGYFFSRPHHG